MRPSNLNPDAQRRHNLRNWLQTAILISGTGLLMGFMAYAVFGTIGLIGASLMGAVGLASLGQVSPKMVLNLYKAKPVRDEELPELHQIMNKLAREAKLQKSPKLYYVPTKMLNAFAVGSREDAAIAVTDGLLRTMNLRQLTGILAHETAHIANGDLRVMGLADVLNRITSILSTIGLIGVPLVFGSGIDIPYAGLALMIFAPTVGGLLQLALSRAREYDADLDGATLTGDPEGLASALALLEQKQRGMWEGMFLPGASMPQPSMLRTHPKTEDRIARLKSLHLGNLPTNFGHTQTMQPQASFVPVVQNPRIRWHRLGIYY